MSIKAGQLIHVGNNVLLDRIQSGGPGNLNIPTDRIYELGNYESLGQVRDTPDLSFNLESFDARAEFEAVLIGNDFATDADGTVYDPSLALPMDVASQFKMGKTATAPFDVVASAVIPFLAVESLSYRFGIRDNATQQATLRGDGIFYSGASAYVETTAGDGTQGQTIEFTNDPVPYNGDTVNGTRYALSVEVVEDGKRLVPGTDYSETAPGDATYVHGAVTLVDAVDATKTVRITYQSATVASYPQVSHEAVAATAPAALRGRDIEVRVGGVAVTDRWSSIQSVNVDWRVQLDKDEELGNQNVVSQDFDVPTVSGTINLKPRDPAELIARIKQIAGVASNESVGALQSTPLPLQIILHSPTDGSTLKTLYVADARFTLPGYSGQVQQKLALDFPFESDSGALKVYKGAMP